jgi:hypothetical protein
MVMEDPIAPVLGVKLAILGMGATVNGLPALATPPAAVTTMLPEVEPAGTVAVTLLVVQLVIVAAMPLKVTWLPAP